MDGDCDGFTGTLTATLSSECITACVGSNHKVDMCAVVVVVVIVSSIVSYSNGLDMEEDEKDGFCMWFNSEIGVKTGHGM